MNAKTCAKCKQTKPLAQFGRDRSRKDGLTCWCKMCKNIADRERYRADPEKENARTSQYQKNNRAKANAWKRKWRKANPEKILATKVRYRRKHTDRDKARAAVSRAVRCKKLPAVTTLKCIRCGKQASEYHHHKGYAEEHRLDVVPACIKCHRILDYETK